MTTAQKSTQTTFLSRAFSYAKNMHPVNKALLVAAAAMHLVPTSVINSGIEFYRDSTAQKVDTLSTGEAALVQAVFGADFDTNNIRKRYSNNETACGETGNADTAFVACVRRSSPTITFAASADFMDDYSRDGSMSGSRISTFMHEVTHIWQHRTEARNGGQCTSYDLPQADIMNKALTFDDYCSERQGQLIGNYAAFYLRPSQIGAISLREPEGQYFDRIRQIVEAKFPRAIAARQMMQRRAQQHFACFNAAANNASAQNTCNARYYLNLRGQPLTTTAQQVTFTLPNGQVRYPVIEAAQRAARPTS